jgi:hypothetical protein
LSLFALGGGGIQPFVGGASGPRRSRRRTSVEWSGRIRRSVDHAPHHGLKVFGETRLRQEDSGARFQRAVSDRPVRVAGEQDDRDVTSAQVSLQAVERLGDLGVNGSSAGSAESLGATCPQGRSRSEIKRARGSITILSPDRQIVFCRSRLLQCRARPPVPRRGGDTNGGACRAG